MPDAPLDAWIKLPIKIGTVEQVHACGVITLTYNRLEEFLIFLFDAYFPLTDSDKSLTPGVVCAEMLNNRKRLDLLKVLVEAQEKDSEVKSRVLDALTVFEICAENRNILAHGQSDDADYNFEILTIRKIASGGTRREVFFDIPLSRLRDLANEMVVAMDYFWHLNMFLLAHRLTPTVFQEEYGPDFYPALPDKPQKPRKLSPRPPAKDR